MVANICANRGRREGNPVGNLSERRLSDGREFVANDLRISERDLNRLSKTPLINGRVSRVHAA